MVESVRVLPSFARSVFAVNSWGRIFTPLKAGTVLLLTRSYFRRSETWRWASLCLGTLCVSVPVASGAQSQIKYPPSDSTKCQRVLPTTATFPMNDSTPRPPLLTEREKYRPQSDYPQGPKETDLSSRDTIYPKLWCSHIFCFLPHIK